MDSGASSSRSPFLSPTTSFSSSDTEYSSVRYRFPSPSHAFLGIPLYPIRFPPTVTHKAREERPFEPLLPWRHLLVAAALGFVPEPRNFIPDEVKTPQWPSTFSVEEVREANQWLEKMQVQHMSYITYHAQCLAKLEKTEVGLQKLEAEPADWEKFGLGKLDPLPMFLRDFYRDLRRGRDGR